jgi:hypothetical protein
VSRSFIPRLGSSALALPIALLSSACTLRPWTPSTSVAFWSEDPPAARYMTVPSQTEIITRWQLPPTNPWARYEKYTLLTALDSVPRTAPMPDVTQLDVVHKANTAAARVAAAGLPNDTMWVVDLRGAASVTFGAQLSQSAREPVSLVLTFNNWPAENELIPAEETLAALIAFQPRLPSANDVGTRPVFMLDAWRLAYRFDEPDDDITDNRYILNQSDLPDPQTLRANGIRRIVYVVEDLDETEHEEDDLQAAFLAYQDAGITIYMVDLSFLAKPIVHDRWNEVLAPRVCYIEHRRTLIDDPLFYARARGGFGGIHSGPSPLRGGGGGGWTGGHGGG